MSSGVEIEMIAILEHVKLPIPQNYVATYKEPLPWTGK
jgi:hypothetical protein